MLGLEDLGVWHNLKDAYPCCDMPIGMTVAAALGIVATEMLTTITVCAVCSVFLWPRQRTVKGLRTKPSPGGGHWGGRYWRSKTVTRTTVIVVVMAGGGSSGDNGGDGG